VLGTVASVLYFSRRRGLAIRPRLLPRPHLEVLPQTELLGDKAVLETVPLQEEPVTLQDEPAAKQDVGPRVA
jgi:hypothetical protein